jgi:hypothetical protein
MTVEGTASYHQTTSLWTPNPGGARTMAEARAIAEENGAYIADDVHFIPVKDSLYDSKFGNSYATYGRFTVSDLFRPHVRITSPERRRPVFTCRPMLWGAAGACSAADHGSRCSIFEQSGSSGRP